MPIVHLRAVYVHKMMGPLRLGFVICSASMLSAEFDNMHITLQIMPPWFEVLFLWSLSFCLCVGMCVCLCVCV